jgi:hypothetical protein
MDKSVSLLTLIFLVVLVAMLFWVEQTVKDASKATSANQEAHYKQFKVDRDKEFAEQKAELADLLITNALDLKKEVKADIEQGTSNLQTTADRIDQNVLGELNKNQDQIKTATDQTKQQATTATAAAIATKQAAERTQVIVQSRPTIPDKPELVEWASKLKGYQQSLQRREQDSNAQIKYLKDTVDYWKKKATKKHD